MPHFMVQYWDKPGSGPLRAPNREAHIAYRIALGPKLVLAGPLFDDFNDAPPLGTVVILDAPNKAEAKRVALEDPYYKAGVFERVDVYAHRILALNPPPKS